MFTGVFLLTRCAPARNDGAKGGADAGGGAGAKLASFQRDSFEFDLAGGGDGDGGERIPAGRHAGARPAAGLRRAACLSGRGNLGPWGVPAPF